MLLICCIFVSPLVLFSRVPSPQDLASLLPRRAADPSRVGARSLPDDKTLYITTRPDTRSLTCAEDGILPSAGAPGHHAARRRRMEGSPALSLGAAYSTTRSAR